MSSAEDNARLQRTKDATIAYNEALHKLNTRHYARQRLLAELHGSTNLTHSPPPPPSASMVCPLRHYHPVVRPSNTSSINSTDTTTIK
jgi:hypothetical protein